MPESGREADVPNPTWAVGQLLAPRYCPVPSQSVTNPTCCPLCPGLCRFFGTVPVSGCRAEPGARVSQPLTSPGPRAATMTFPSLGPASNPWRKGEVAPSPSCRRQPCHHKWLHTSLRRDPPPQPPGIETLGMNPPTATGAPLSPTRSVPARCPRYLRGPAAPGGCRAAVSRSPDRRLPAAPGCIPGRGRRRSSGRAAPGGSRCATGGESSAQPRSRGRGSGLVRPLVTLPVCPCAGLPVPVLPRLLAPVLLSPSELAVPCPSGCPLRG